MDLTRVTRKPVYLDLGALLEGADPGVITSAAIAFLPTRADPDASTVWTSVTYANPTATFVIAGPDAGGSGAIVVPGTCDLWVRATAPTWVDAVLVERINVLDGTALGALPDGAVSDAYVAGLVTGPATATRDALELLIGASGAEIDPGYDVILLAGQSNMSGRGGSPVPELDPTDARIWQYAATGTYTNQLSLANDPLGHNDGVSAQLGPAMTFARWWATTLGRGRRVLLVPVAQGNTNVNSTGWGAPTGTLYQLAITQVQGALAAGGAGSRVVAVLWHQGESSTAMTEAAYAAALDGIIAGWRTAFGDPTLPFIVGQMVPDRLMDPGLAAVNRAHIDTPARVAQTGFAAAPVTGVDDQHFTAPGYRILGRRYFNELVRVLAGAAFSAPPAVPAAPVPVLGSATTTSLTLTWPAVTNALEYRVEREGPPGTWTAVAFPTAAGVTLTGLTASTSYTHRVWAVGQRGASATAGSVTASTAGAGPTTYALDTFTRADNASSAGTTETGGFAWTPSASNTYGILTNQLRTVVATTQPAHCLIGDGQADGTLKVTIKTGSTLSAGIAFRVSADDSTGYVFYHSNTGAYTLRRRTGTTYTVLATGTGPTAAVDDVIEVVLNGSSITCKQNGATVATATDATYTGTRHGVMSISSNQPLFDDFSHTSVTS